MKTKRIYPSNFSATCKNKAKARRGAHHFKTGKYKRQWDITAANKAKRKARLFSFCGILEVQRTPRHGYFVELAATLGKGTGITSEL